MIPPLNDYIFYGFEDSLHLPTLPCCTQNSTTRFSAQKRASPGSFEMNAQWPPCCVMISSMQGLSSIAPRRNDEIGTKGSSRDVTISVGLRMSASNCPALERS